METEQGTFEVENITEKVVKQEIERGSEVGMPPYIVVVQGGKNSGKSTLIRSLVKYYTNQNINFIRGAITIRNSKSQRITFIECPEDISAMIDLSKITDIAIVMVDASNGFEMNSFEYLCLLKNHGFTSVMGVLTHMDEFKQNKSLKKLKKELKKRFHKEVTDKAKLFYLFGIKNKLYLKLQMHNLARYLRVIKPNPIGFRENHPYIFADRYDVVFPSNNIGPEDDVMVSFFGYVRGGHFNKNSNIHINGLGDYQIDFMTSIEDPCPIETVTVGGKKRKTLKQQEKFLYAPYCNINSLEYDKNIGYINIPDRFVSFTKGVGENPALAQDEGVQMVRNLQDIDKKKTLNSQFEKESFQLFDGIDIKESTRRKKEAGDKFTVDSGLERKKKSEVNSLIRDFKLKNEPQFFKEHVTNDMNKFIYEEETTSNSNDIEDTYKFNNVPQFDLNFYIKNAKKRFVTGSNFIEQEGFDLEEESEDSGDGKKKKQKQKKGKKNEDEELEKVLGGGSLVGKWKKGAKTQEETLEEEAAQMMMKENGGQNNKVPEDTTNKIQEFCTEEYGFFEKGIYVRVDLKKIKRKHVDHFNVNYPLVLCSTNLQEVSMGFLKVRFTKHIFYPKVLKNNDPIIFSIGWRKFQSIPMFCIEEANKKLRMIKYSPKYSNCFAIFYGPFLPIGTAMVAIQKYTEDIKHFRICATGELLEVNHHFQINKKLKLIGEPMEIFKKTAFVKGMFNTNLEASRYIGASVRTVSGIRGQIKKNLNSGVEGSVRVTFEDKILKSDIVFLKTFTTVEPEAFYNPVVKYESNQFMRTMAELRRDYNIALPQNKDSEYKDIVREDRVFPNLLISKSLEKSLPFKNKNKVKTQISGMSGNYEEDDTFLLKKLGLPVGKPLKSVLSEKEKSIYSMLQRLQTIKNVKDKNIKQYQADEAKKNAAIKEKEDRLKRKRLREKMIKSIKKKKKD